MPKTILIIEDEHDMREAIATALKNNGFHTITAENGEQGVDKALEIEPDLILLDLLMPVMDGQAVLKALREHPWGETAKVVILTAMDDIKNVGEAYEANVAGYITKSESSLAEIVMKVKEIIEQK